MRETSGDPFLSRVLQFVLSGWPEECNVAEMKSFWSRQMELSVQQGFLLWWNRVVVPRSLCPPVLSELHDSHPAISHMKALGRTFVWWVRFNQEAEEVVWRCTECQSTRAAPLTTMGMAISSRVSVAYGLCRPILGALVSGGH